MRSLTGCVVSAAWMCVVAVVDASEHANKSCNIKPKPATDIPSLPPALDKSESALLMLVGFGGFSIALAVMYKLLRKYVFHDNDNIDTTFDAGGNVSMSLTAVTVASQLLWPADLLQSSTVTVRSGIAAPFWYTVGAVTNMLLFPILSVRFKSIAPGAKTYLQLIHARHGRAAHIWYCFLALLLNFIIITCLLVSSRATIQALTKDASHSYVCIVTAVLFGSYSFIGGLGTTFYVSYFNALLIAIILMLIIFSILFSPASVSLGLGNMNQMYDILACMEGPAGNYENSYLTFRSVDSLMWGLIGICLTSSLTFCDQASWQSRIAAKPSDGVIGFIVATAIWFSIPSALGTTAGMAYLVMSQQNGTHLLTENEINIGLVTPFVTERLFGKAGAYLILTMNTMAIMSTGSGEVMAAASIIVYDIYQAHINPFRPDIPKGHCKFCEKRIAQPDSPSTDNVEYCSCPVAEDCISCKRDIANHVADRNRVVHTCALHANMREYQGTLMRYKSWCIIWLTIAIVPIGLAALSAGLTLNWTLLYGVMISVSGFPGVLLSVMWVKCSRLGVIAGSVIALILTLVVNLAMASIQPGGLANFFETTVHLTSVFAAGATSLFVNFFVVIVTSLIVNRNMTEVEKDAEWEATHDIDNALFPWAYKFLGEVPDLKAGQRPSVKQLMETSKKARKQAYIGSGFLMVLFIIIIPIIMVSFPVLSFEQFQGWVLFCIGWAFAMAGVAMVLAPIQETIQIVTQMKRNKKRRGSSIYSVRRAISVVMRTSFTLPMEQFNTAETERDTACIDTC